jgi:cell division protein FtsN
MERNRVLWVIFSICLFLVVVLAGGLYLLRPAAGGEAEVTAGQAPPVRSFDAFEYVRGRSELPPLAEKPEEGEESVIVVGEREEAPPEKPQIVLDLPESSGAAAPAPKSPAARPSTASPAARPAARPARPPARPAAESRPAARQEPKPAAAVQPREVSVTEYWIQAGSYTSPFRAREVARALDDQGLAPKITSRALSDRTYYRVRIGPYLSKAEAEKFLEWVKALKGFETSYISMVHARRQDP